MTKNEASPIQPVAKAAPTAESLLKLIDAEIVVAGSENGRRGITPWALLIALGGLFWSLTEPGAFNKMNAALIAVATTTAIESLGFVAGLIADATPRPVTRPAARFRTVAEIFGCSTLCLVFRSLYGCAAVALVSVLALDARIPRWLFLAALVSEALPAIAIPVRSWVVRRLNADFARHERRDRDDVIARIG